MKYKTVLNRIPLNPPIPPLPKGASSPLVIAKQSHPAGHCERPKVAWQSRPTVITSRRRSNLKLSFLVFCFGLSSILLFAQQTYNLEIIFQKTAWDSYPDLYDYGISLAGGDINGDSYSDIFVGASHWVDSLSWWAIDIYGFYGSAVMDTSYDIILHCPPHLGHNESHLCCGDLNGDSLVDLVVGDPGGGGNAKIRIYYGGSPFDTIVDMKLNNIGTFGNAVACGDINGDQFDDLVVGSYTAGRVYVYYGGPLLDTLPDVMLSGTGNFGQTVGSGGDLNSDGFDDIVVGADENSEAYPGAGKVSVFFGGNPMDTIPDCWLHGEGVNHYLGWTGVDILKNVTQYSRMLTGSPFWPNGFPAASPGKIYIMNGDAAMDTLVDWWITGETDSSSLGTWSSSAGNCENNMFNDLISGAPAITDFHQGGIGLLWLAGINIDTTADAWLSDDNTLYYLIGFRVASAGDVNGDGFDEVMFSNYPADSNQTVWVCRYTGPGIEEQRTEGIVHFMAFTVYPTIFTDKLVIKCQIPKAKYKMNAKCQISIKIYDVLGREVISYESKKEEVRSEKYEEKIVRIDARGLPSGVYFVQVEVDGMKEVKKAIKIE